MFFDPMYLLFIAPGLLLALWAQFRVKSAYSEGSRYAPQSGLSGAATAQRILDLNGLHDVSIERVDSFLGDHYDPRHKVLRLSPGVFDGRTLAAVGIAAHEVGHAIQHAHAYAPLALRSALVPVAMLGDNLAFLLIFIGLLIHPFVAMAGVFLFALAVLFTLVTLPVEYDASSRARAILVGNGLVTMSEDQIVGKVLNAAALTYVAAAVTAILQLLYYLSLVSGRRDD
jgi:hypothetical protein